MSEQKMDMAKVLAMLSQPREELPPLEGVERRIMEVSYITKAETVETRTVRIFFPEEAARPVPLIYVPHYEIGEDSVELRGYLRRGWAVASVSPFLHEYNAGLTDNDLVFNNAALYALRHMPEIDPKRIALVGGSAGGYTTAMLNGLQLGFCASVSNGTIANTYFNMVHHAGKVQALNMAAMARLAAQPAPEEEADPNENPALRLMRSMAKLPIPFAAALMGFSKANDNFPDVDDTERWEALSAIGVADRYGSPVMFNHSTSDILVPVDQITRRFTYEKPGDSLPEDFSVRLPHGLKGRLSMSLEDCLPPEETRTERFPVPENAPESVLPYDPSKRFHLNIFDDGPVEGYGSHSARMDVGRRDDVPYLADMLARGATETCVLRPAMLREFLLRWQGKSIALPGHTGVDDSLYGSLAVYRKEIAEELSAWRADHGGDALEAVWEELLRSEAGPQTREAFTSVMKEIRNHMEAV